MRAAEPAGSGLGQAPASHSFDANAYPFADVVKEALGANDLAGLHEHTATHARFDRASDQSTEFHARFYDFQRSSPAFGDLYRRFVADVVEPLIGDEPIFQRIPNLRIALPDNVAVGEFHRDADYNHSREEINFWVPVTRAWDTNTVWVESEPDKGDFAPVELDYGEFVTFAGASLRHGNQTNQTGRTRVSFDFRIIPARNYRPRGEKTINAEMRFLVGEYFDRFDRR